jgi:hypothetical protein
MCLFQAAEEANVHGYGSGIDPWSSAAGWVLKESNLLRLGHV